MSSRRSPRSSRDNGVTLVVVGLPLSLDGSHGSRAIHAEAFAETLRAVLPVPVAMQDERFTTLEAERVLRSAGLKAPERRSVVDAEAARIALQAWLDARPTGASTG